MIELDGLKFQDKQITIPQEWLFVLLEGLEYSRKKMLGPDLPKNWSVGDLTDLCSLIVFLRRVRDDIDEKMSNGN